MTTEHTLQQLKEIAEAGGELLGFIVVNGEGHGGYAWGYSRRAAEDELMAVKVAENPAHGPFAIVAAHTPTISKVDALDLIAQVEKLERLLWELAREIHDERGCMCEEDERGSRNLCAPCQVADLLGSPGKWKIDPSVPDEPVKEGTARDGTGQ